MQAVGIVMVCGFFVMGLLAYRTYSDEPPIPEQVTDPSGRVLFTATNVERAVRVPHKSRPIPDASIVSRRLI